MTDTAEGSRGVVSTLESVPIVHTDGQAQLDIPDLPRHSVSILTLSCDEELSRICALSVDSTLSADPRLDWDWQLGWNGNPDFQPESIEDANLYVHDFVGRTFNFSHLNNLLTCKTGRHSPTYLLFLNDDVIVRGDWLVRMIEVAENRQASTVGIRLVYPAGHPFAGRIQHCGVDPGMYRAGTHRGRYAVMTAERYITPPEMRTWAVTGACLLCRTEDFVAVGGFDEGYKDVSQDIDLCMKLREHTGHGSWVVQDEFCWHIEGASRDGAWSTSVWEPATLYEKTTDMARFQKKWGTA